VEVPVSQTKVSLRMLLAAAAGASVYYPLLLVK